MTISPLAQAVGDLDEATAIVLVEDKLATGEAPLSILEELQAGMNIVGERFEDGEYFLSELIYAADIFKKAGAPLQEELKSQRPGDARHPGPGHGQERHPRLRQRHRGHGHELQRHQGHRPGRERGAPGLRRRHQGARAATLVGMSCLLTTVFDDMRDAIRTIKAAGLRDQVTILIGGGPVDQATADYVGADYYCKTAQDGVIAAKKVLGVS